MLRTPYREIFIFTLILYTIFTHETYLLLDRLDFDHVFLYFAVHHEHDLSSSLLSFTSLLTKAPNKIVEEFQANSSQLSDRKPSPKE